MELSFIVYDVFSVVTLLLEDVELVRSASLRNEIVVSFYDGTDALGMQVWVAGAGGRPLSFSRTSPP